MDQTILDLLDDVEHIANLLKATFVGKDELVELLLTSAIAQEHLLIVGPPGTAKSDLIKRFALLCSPDAGSNGRRSYFEYLLTRFTEPNEIFGPINVAAFRDAQETRRNTAQMLPQAEIVFLDEVFKSNSAILNALLTILNERTFYNGGQTETVPLLCAVGATNSIPDDDELGALYDRFLLRAWTDNVEETEFGDLFNRGWKLEKERIARGHGLRLVNVTTTDSLRKLHQALETIDLSGVAQPYREVIRRIRADGIQVSDRRVIKLLKLVAASALRHKRPDANPGDFWILRHVWNDPEQIPRLQTIVNPYVEAFEGEVWSPERPLADIAADLTFLEGRRDSLSTDTDYADFLQQVEGLRRELLRHSAATAEAPAAARQQQQQLVEQAAGMIDNLMQLLDQTL